MKPIDIIAIIGLILLAAGLAMNDISLAMVVVGGILFLAGVMVSRTRARQGIER